MKKLLALLLLAFTTGFLIRFPTPALAGPPDNLQVAMRILKLNAAKLGDPSVKGEETVDGKSLPALYFGTTKMNNNFVLVDEVQKEVGGTATIFVKSGNESYAWRRTLKKMTSRVQ